MPEFSLRLRMTAKPTGDFPSRLVEILDSDPITTYRRIPLCDVPLEKVQFAALLTVTHDKLEFAMAYLRELVRAAIGLDAEHSLELTAA